MNSKGQSPSAFAQQLRRQTPVKLIQILESDTHLDGDCIEVQILWNSGIQEFQRKGQMTVSYSCHFIFSDDTGHISASMYLPNKEDVNGKNLYKLLQPKKICRITKFIVKNTSGRAKLEDNNVRTLRDQLKKLELPPVSRNVICIGDWSQATGFFNHIPFSFVEFADIDEQEFHTQIDIVAYVGNVKEVKKKVHNDGKVTSYQHVTLQSSCKEEEAFQRNLALFKDNIGSMKPNTVYAISNVKLSEFKSNMSLSATYLSVIKEIDRNSPMQWLPEKYHNADFVWQLFPVPTSSYIETSNALQRPPRRRFTSSSLPETEERLSQLAISPPKKPRLALESVEVEVKPVGDVDMSSQDSDVILLEIEYDYIPDPPLVTVSSDSEEGSISQNSKNESQEEEAKRVYNFLDQNKPLKVVVEKAIKFMDIGREAYYMRSNRRGVALIIHNTHFPHRDEGVDRKGGVHDARYLRDFLHQCGFEVEVKCNMKSTELQQFIAKFKTDVESKYGKVDALVVVILSHGSFWTVEMVDDRTVNLYDDIIYHFDENAFSVMKGKPKIFILQTCQNFHPGVPVTPFGVERQRNAGGLENMIICFPTSPGSNSLRDIYLGSHFIYVLTDVLMKNAHKLHFVEMLEKVQKKLKNVKYHGKDLLASTWTPYGFKKLYFNPGL